MMAKHALALSLTFVAVTGCGGTSVISKDAGPDAQPDAPTNGIESDAGPRTFSVGGTVAGLAGTGLILSDGAGHQVAIPANGTFLFAARLPAGASTTVTVSQQPSSPSQDCAVTGAALTGIASNVTSIAVLCVTKGFTVAATVSGLISTGLVLQNNGSDDLVVTANGPVIFPTNVASGATFTVSVKTAPTAPPQACQVSGGSGTVGGANVTSVAVTCGVGNFTIGGTTTGLVGMGLVLQNSAGDDLSLTTNGAFAFATPVHEGDAFAVTVKKQPESPAQTCTVSQGNGTAAAAHVSTVAVTCSTNSYAVGGTVTGLVGSGLVLQNGLGDNLNVAAAGAFTFAKGVSSGGLYGVTVLTQPSSPSQTCTITGGTGIIGAGVVTGVSVACSTNTYTIGGTVAGLMGSGLKLQNAGGDDLVIAANGAFTFATSQPSGAAFAVTIAAQPGLPDQTCSLAGATGTVGGTAVSSIIVNCDTNQHVVGGTVAGLTGTNLSLSLNGGAPQVVSGNGAFAFATTLPSAGTYLVALVSQPASPSQTCAVTAGAGTIGSADITTVAVTCTTDSHAVTGTVTGLTGTGLLLQNNAGAALPVTADGGFAFATKVPSGQSYDVTVAAQPTAPAQTCVVTHGSGGVAGSDVSDVVVTCTTNKYAVRGTVVGLAGTLIIRNGSGDSLTLTANGPFAFATLVSSGAPYAAIVVTQPVTPDQLCAISSGSGTITNAAVTEISITCMTNAHTIGGSLVGLVGAGLVLQDNGGDDLAVTSGTTFAFATPIASGAAYAVTIKTQPAAQTCMVGGGTGSVGGSDVSSVIVNCSANTYVIGGTVTGLFGAGLVLQNNGGHDVPISGSGSFAFTPPLLGGAPYAITVKANPTGPWQTCTVTGGTGTVTNVNVSAQVSCVSTPFPVSVDVANVAGAGLVLQNNAGDNLPVSADGTYTFPTPVRSGLTYAVTVLSQPAAPWQTCSVSGPAGAIANGRVTLAVTCFTNKYTIGGTVRGVEGSGLMLLNNGGDAVSISGDGSFTFAKPIASGAYYAVTIGAFPTGPEQVCAVANGTGTPNIFNVTNVEITCADATPDCAAVDENDTLVLTCPDGQTIVAIDFASYGTPEGTCGDFAKGDCDASGSVVIVSDECVGAASCSVPATNDVFGDPCGGTYKRLWAQFTCQ